MPSRIRRKVEPAYGWLFVIAVVAAVGFVIFAATRPHVEMTGHFLKYQQR
jgi:hypothetical protein